MRRYLFVTLAGLLLLAGCAVTREPSATEPGLGAALADLAVALWSFLALWANLIYRVQVWLWEVLGPELRPLLGLLHCLNVVVVAWAVYAWLMVRRMARRVLGA